MWDLLEHKRLTDLYLGAKVLQGNNIGLARCFICTLELPCKHYACIEDFMKDAQPMMENPDIKKMILPNKRDNILQ